MVYTAVFCKYHGISRYIFFLRYPTLVKSLFSHNNSSDLISLYITTCIIFPITEHLLQHNERGFPLIFTKTKVEFPLIRNNICYKLNYHLPNSGERVYTKDEKRNTKTWNYSNSILISNVSVIYIFEELASGGFVWYHVKRREITWVRYLYFRYTKRNLHFHTSSTYLWFGDCFMVLHSVVCSLTIRKL
jgi:hypothetical protein